MTRTVVEQITQAGVQKLRFSGAAPGRYLTRAALAGAFIFVGALLSSLCAAWFYDANLPLAKLLGALAFSAALTLIVLLGGELFTGCPLVMSVSLYDGRVRLAGTLRVWALAYLGNLLAFWCSACCWPAPAPVGSCWGPIWPWSSRASCPPPGICSSSGACCAIFWCASACSPASASRARTDSMSHVPMS